MDKTLDWLWLQRFAEGGEGAADGGEAEGAQADGNVDNVAQEPAQDETVPKTTFDELIKGEYKDDYQKAVDKIINKRFAQAKSTEEELGRYKGYDPVLSLLADRYGVDASDPEGLAKAIQNDEAHIRAYADERGISLDEAKRQVAYEGQMRELEMLKKEKANQQRQYVEEQQRKEFNARVQKGVEETMAVYGDAFDIDREMENPEFLNLLSSHVGVKTAFEVLHKDELLTGAIKYAVADTQKRVVQDIAAKGKRPLENGIAPSKAGAGTFDVNKITKQADKEIEAKVRRGERVTVEDLRAAAQK